jgi:hypothetical protein
MNGALLFEVTAQQDDLNWQDFSFLYTATSPSIVLSLSSQINGTQVSYSIDNIDMYATPEPSGLSLIFLGSGLLIFVRKRYRHTMQTKLD